MRKLTPKEVDAIEARLEKQKVSPEDVRRLIYTVRRLEAKVKPGKDRSGNKPLQDTARAHKVDPGGTAVEIFTDGACSGNPGPGGWGAVIRIGSNQHGSGGEYELSGGEKRTTNNRMELTAAIEALRSLEKPSQVSLWTDSEYLMKGITSWIRNWKRNGWKNAKKEPVKNADLWKELDGLQHTHSIDWNWVKGHSGHPENERCDELARTEIRRIRN